MTVLRATVFETLPRAWRTPSKTAASPNCANQLATTTTKSPTNFSSSAEFSNSREKMASAGGDSLAEYGIENADIKTAPGVSLTDVQRVLTASVLDLFAGRPTVKKLSLWQDDAKFEDPLTNAQGRKQYAAQWYGLAAAFSEIERLDHQVISSGNPIGLDLKTRYVVKGLGVEKIIESKVNIFTEGDKICKVEDRWNGQLPEGPFKTAMRNLNSVVVPAFVNVPKSEEEEAAKKQS